MNRRIDGVLAAMTLWLTFCSRGLLAGEIADIRAFLEQCPTTDPAYEQIRRDFEVRKNGIPVGEIACTEPLSQLPVSEYTDELVVLQGLRVAYYMDRGQSGHLPWTSGTLYDWMKSRVDGIDIRPGGSYCCVTMDGKTFMVVGAQNDANRDFDREWRGLSGNIGLYAHEARHADGFPHVSCCGIERGCDETYDPQNMTSYGIQYWLNSLWLSGVINVGYACLPGEEVSQIAQWHTSARFERRFCNNPPAPLVVPEAPGGPCPGTLFLRGDANADGDLNIADPIFVLNHLFGGGPASLCLQTADANDDNVLDLSDPVYELNHFFGGGPALNPPVSNCGTDPTPAENAAGNLSCDVYPPCQRQSA